jgi:hypothetical protein
MEVKAAISLRGTHPAMKIWKLSYSLVIFACTMVTVCAGAQSLNATQSVSLQGLRTSATHGNFPAAVFASDGSLFLLLDEQDGVRILKTDPTGSTILAETHLGARGDSPIAMALDPNGGIYIVGTTSSGSLTATSGAAFQSVADQSTNSFLGGYDGNLNLVFLTFLGSGRTAVMGVAATPDAVFVTGITFNAAFPVTAAAVQQSPAPGSSENGFVERFSADGSALAYASYLTGANGSTIPAAIVADSSDNAYVAGSTSSSGYPTFAALQPSILLTNGASSSGFLTRLNPTGSAFVFSTFIAGVGITGLAFDAATGSLLMTGNVALGQFPVATVAMPLTSASYQTLLRIPVDGQSVSSSVVLVPGTQSFVNIDSNGGAWISGALTTPLFPPNTPPDYNSGDSFLLHLTAKGNFDRTLRFGGLPVDHASNAALTSNVGIPQLNGVAIALPGTITTAMDTSLLTTQRFDLPMAATPSDSLPNVLSDLAPDATECGTNSQCSGTGALLAMVNTAASAPMLSVSSGDLPNLTLRNLGSIAASGIVLSPTGFTVTSNCGATLKPWNQCSLALTGNGPGSLTVSAANASMVALSLPASTLVPAPIVLSTNELDFGIATSLDPTSSRTVTVSNLSAESQTFSSTQAAGATDPAYAIAETASDCVSGGSAGVHVLAPASSCHISLGLAIASTVANDEPVRAVWTIGDRDVVLTGFAQTTAVHLSAEEIDFGTQFSAITLRLPRYLYLSNNSGTPIPHAEVSLPADSPFGVIDGCPPVLQPHSVCQMTLSYLSPISPSNDATTIELDGGISVLVTGTTMPQTTPTASSTNPSLSLSANALTFPTPVVVTQLASALQILTIANTGGNSFSLAITVGSDFYLVNGCPSQLAVGDSCLVQVGFAPSQPGQRDGLLSVAAGSGFTPVYVSLTGTGSAILPATDGTSLDLGQTLLGVPVVAWYKVQQPIVSLTVDSNSNLFGLALVADTGTGHGSLAASNFSQTVTSNCNNCWLGVQFFPNAAGPVIATLVLKSTPGGNPYQLTLNGVGLPVEGMLLTPAEQDFGPVAVNSSTAAITFTLTNALANKAEATIQSVTVNGDFLIAANDSGGASCAGTLASTASCFVQVVFAPTANGERSGTLTIVTSAGTVTAALAGYGSADPGLAINPAAVTFSDVPGTTATQHTIALSNTGTTALIIGSPSVSNPSFSVSSDCAILEPGVACNLMVGFTPSSATMAATLSIPVTSAFNGQPIAMTYTVALAGGYTSVDAGLQIIANDVNYGSTPTGSEGMTREFTVNNLTNTPLSVSFSLPRQFPLALAAPCPSLAAGGSCNFSLTFLPATGGPQTGTVLVQGTPLDGSAAVQALAYVQGYGAAAGGLAITGNTIPNSSLYFGQVMSGQSAQQVLTLTNNGTSSLAIRRITSEPPFLSTSSCGSALAPNTSCSVTLTYAPINEVLSSLPAAPRADQSIVTVESDAISSPDILPLDGSVTPVVSSDPASSAILSSFILSQSALTFANTQVGNESAAQTVVLTNTGTTTIHILSTTVSTDFVATSTCLTLLPGAVCSFSVEFAPTAAPASTVRSGAMEILSDAGTSLEFVSLLGTSAAASLTLSPASLDFGTVNVGQHAALSVSVTNSGMMAVTFLGLTASGDYTASSGSCPAIGSPLPVGTACTLTVTFTPSATGARTGTLSLTNDASQLPLTVALSGTAVEAQLQVTPGSLVFGGIDTGFSGALTLTLLNTGSANVTGIANMFSGTNAADFALTAPCSTSTLAPNQGCTETVTFTPSAIGARSATLTVASSDPSGPAIIPLSGSGLKAGSFTLTVNGATAATLTVASGSPGTYALLLTPANGFTGPVALTCSPSTAGEYTSCSLLASTLTLGSSALSSTATINTITSEAGAIAVALSGLFLAPFMLIRRRRDKKEILAWMFVLICGLGFASLTGCGGHPAGVSNTRTTPAGTYQYQVTASSTSGAVVSSTVTLTLVVQ